MGAGAPLLSVQSPKMKSSKTTNIVLYLIQLNPTNGAGEAEENEGRQKVISDNYLLRLIYIDQDIYIWLLRFFAITNGSRIWIFNEEWQ